LDVQEVGKGYNPTRLEEVSRSGSWRKLEVQEFRGSFIYALEVGRS